MVIFKGKIHQSKWYDVKRLPQGTMIAVNDNGWTNNSLNSGGLRDVLDKYTRPWTSGQYRLLILFGHASHNSIVTAPIIYIVVLYMPAHSSHFLQP